jgi:hypothetical protein
MYFLNPTRRQREKLLLFLDVGGDSSLIQTGLCRPQPGIERGRVDRRLAEVRCCPPAPAQLFQELIHDLLLAEPAPSRVAAVSAAGLMERCREADLDFSILLANEEGGLVKGGRPALNSAIVDAEPGTVPGTGDDVAVEPAFVEWAARVGAGRCDGVEAISETDQEDRHIASLGSNQLPLGEVHDRADIGPVGHPLDEGAAIDHGPHSKAQVTAEEGAEEDYEVSQARDQDAGEDESAARLVAEE